MTLSGAMGLLRVSLVAAAAVLFFAGVLEGQGKFSWMKYDKFDEIDDHMNTVNEHNCKSKSREELVLRPDTVSQVRSHDQFNSIKSNLFRTCLCLV